MALKLITPPAVEPVLLADLDEHMRVATAEESATISAYIATAREYCEGFQNRAYITQTFELWLDVWPRKNFITIPRPPLQTITSIKYYGTDNTEYTMPVTDYFVDAKSDPGRVVLAYGKYWPTTTLRPANGVVVTFVAGYGDAGTAVPQKVKQSIRMLTGHYYENREATIIGKKGEEVQFAVNALLTLDRVVPI